MASFDEEKTANKRLLWLIQTVCPNHKTLRTGKQGARSAEVGASAAGLKNQLQNSNSNPEQSYFDAKGMFFYGPLDMDVLVLAN